MKSAIERFEEKYVIDEETGCYNWVASIHPNGYGRFGFEGKTQKAHRVSYMLFKGPIPHGKLVLHSCDNPKCVNIEHLRVGTQKENIADMINRGRDVRRNREKTECPKCGSKFTIDSIGKRYCKPCRKKHQELWRNKQKKLRKKVDTNIIISLNL